LLTYWLFVGCGVVLEPGDEPPDVLPLGVDGVLAFRHAKTTTELESAIWHFLVVVAVVEISQDAFIV
jgi:hypothetical protein